MILVRHLRPYLSFCYHSGLGNFQSAPHYPKVVARSGTIADFQVFDESRIVHMPERRMLIGFPPLARLQANKHAPYGHSAKYDLNRRWRLYAARMTRR